MLKTGVYFTGTGPILILTTYDSLTDPKLIDKLAAKGIKKFIAFEVSESKVKERYGVRFDVVVEALSKTNDLRVLDYNGHNVFYNFSVKNLGEPHFHESM